MFLRHNAHENDSFFDDNIVGEQNGEGKSMKNQKEDPFPLRSDVPACHDLDKS